MFIGVGSITLHHRFVDGKCLSIFFSVQSGLSRVQCSDAQHSFVGMSDEKIPPWRSKPYQPPQPYVPPDEEWDDLSPEEKEQN